MSEAGAEMGLELGLDMADQNECREDSEAPRLQIHFSGALSMLLRLWEVGEKLRCVRTAQVGPDKHLFSLCPRPHGRWSSNTALGTRFEL